MISRIRFAIASFVAKARFGFTTTGGRVRYVFAFLGNRLHEKSTYMFWLASIGSVAGLAVPFNFVGFVVLIMAGLVPDRPPPVDPSAK